MEGYRKRNDEKRSKSEKYYKYIEITYTGKGKQRQPVMKMARVDKQV